MSNKLIIAAAGAGKTTHIVKEALRKTGNVLITTYTEANEAEIKSKIIKLNRVIPSHITVQTWFSFLLQHGAKPYQGTCSAKKINGFQLVNSQSGVRYLDKRGFPVFYSEAEFFEEHFFNGRHEIYSDKLPKFVVRCNERANGEVISRIARIYPHIFIDEVQDLAGYDLEIIKLLFKSQATVTLVGDPRQVTYLTHHEKKYSKYREGKIEDFIIEQCKNCNCEVDKSTLSFSHRNNAEICYFSSKLYPSHPATLPCNCPECREGQTEHVGVFLIHPKKLENYINNFKPKILRYSGANENEWNFGNSKGKGFDRVLLYPTKTMADFLKNGLLEKTIKGQKREAFDISKFYVAITRAMHSVGIVHEYNDEEEFIEGLRKY
jgi:DNA helicase-2/ATP-dependent DNA helicase PcrA